MINEQEILRLGEKIADLIEKKGIPVEGFTIQIDVSREEHERLQQELRGRQADRGLTYALGTRRWSIMIACYS